MFEDKIFSIISEIFAKELNNFLSENKRQNVFKNSAKVISAMERDNRSEIASKLNVLFSEENIKKLASSAKGKSGFDVINFIENELRKFFNDYDANEEDIDQAIKIFIDEFKTQLKLKYPEVYEQVLLNEFSENTKSIKSNSEIIIASIQEANNIENIVLKVPFIQENWLRNNSRYNIDLNFFDYGESDIDKKIIDSIKMQDVVYLKFKTKEEGLYYTLRLLKDKIDNIDDIFIVENSENWNKLINKCKNKILIPYFYDNNIVPIFGNKTIYILSDEDNVVNKNIIEIPNRIRNNLYGCLNKYVKNSDASNRIINKTNGIFPALKRELLTGSLNKPEWITPNNSFLLPALLLSSWSEHKNDKKFLEELSGKRYNEYIRDLQYCINSKDPFIITYVKFTGNEYKVTELFTAWYHLRNYINEDHLNILRKIIEEIFNDKNNELISGIRQVDSGIYSLSLKKGILKSLILMNILGNDVFINRESLSDYAADYVSEILDFVNNKEKIVDYAEFLPYLFEAAPNIFITWIEKEINKEDSALWELFKNTGNSMYGNNGYVYLINALEKALFLNDFVVRSINILEILAAYPLETKIVNSPAHTLKQVFCAWNNEISLSIEEKIELLYLYTEKDYCSWDVLIKVLPSFMGAVYDNLNKPLYLSYEIVNQVKNQDDINSTYKNYFKLAFKFAGDDLNKWKSFFDDGMFLVYGYKDVVIEKIINILKYNDVDDERKYEFSNAIRKFIYRYRYIANKFIKSEDIDDIERNIFSNIKYSNYLYQYLYAFETGAYHTLNPIPYAKGNDPLANQKQKESKQIEFLKIIDNNSSDDLFKFLSMLKRDDSYIGAALFKSKLCIDFDLLNYLYNNNKHEILKGYIYSLQQHEGTDYIFHILDTEFKDKNIEYRMLLLFALNIDICIFYYIEGLSKTEQDYYWENVLIFPNDSNKDIAEKCVIELIKHNNIVNLYYWIEGAEFGVEVYVEYLIKLLQNQEILLSDGNIDYKILRIFEKIYNYNIVDKKILDIIVELEKIFVKIFDYRYCEIKPKYLYEELINNPEVSAALLKDLFKSNNDSNEEISDEKEKLAKIAWNVLYYIKFCPCLSHNKTIDLPELQNWCSKFLEDTKSNGQEEIGLQYLGHFLAHAPADLYYWPNKEICYILDYYKNRDIDRGFILEVRNLRGVHIIDAGQSEVDLANKYKNYAEKCKLEYPYTASLLNKISNDYSIEAKLNRKRAEHE